MLSARMEYSPFSRASRLPSSNARLERIEKMVQQIATEYSLTRFKSNLSRRMTSTIDASGVENALLQLGSDGYSHVILQD